MESQACVEEVFSIKKHSINGQHINCKRFDRQVSEKTLDGDFDILPKPSSAVLDDKAAMLMDEDSDSAVFNKLAQLWSFTDQTSKILFNFKIPTKGIDADTSYYDLNNYRGVNKYQYPPQQPVTYRFNACMNKNVYQRLEERFERYNSAMVSSPFDNCEVNVVHSRDQIFSSK
jgi:hypothetical protein